jgi:hypothetical protein
LTDKQKEWSLSNKVYSFDNLKVKKNGYRFMRAFTKKYKGKNASYFQWVWTVTLENTSDYDLDVSVSYNLVDEEEFKVTGDEKSVYLPVNQTKTLKGTSDFFLSEIDRIKWGVFYIHQNRVGSQRARQNISRNQLKKQSSSVIFGRPGKLIPVSRQHPIWFNAIKSSMNPQNELLEAYITSEQIMLNPVDVKPTRHGQVFVGKKYRDKYVSMTEFQGLKDYVKESDQSAILEELKKNKRYQHILSWLNVSGNEVIHETNKSISVLTFAEDTYSKKVVVVSASVVLINGKVYNFLLGSELSATNLNWIKHKTIDWISNLFLINQ